MRKLEKSWLGRLEELGEGANFSHPQGVPSVIRTGLVNASLTPAGVLALRTGFLPAERDLALLHSLAGRDVLSRRTWSFDSAGLVLEAHGSALAQFRRCGLCARRRGRKGSKTGPYRATRKGQRLVDELAVRFGQGWWRKEGCWPLDRWAAVRGGGRSDAWVANGAAGKKRAQRACAEGAVRCARAE